MNKKRIISSSLDLDNPPPLTPEQKERIRALKALPDAEIDYSDIPPLDVHRMQAKKAHRIPVNQE
jgi:hypothetical protein